MGNSASKTRRLASEVSKTANSGPVVRSNVNQLPNEALKAQYLKHSTEPQELTTTSTSTPQPQDLTPDSKVSLGVSLSSETERVVGPPGKDGHDPQELHKDFIQSVVDLGRQIHSTDANGNASNALALRQLRNRKNLFNIGQKQLELQKQGKAVNSTMVNPHTLSAILDALAEANANTNSIAADYNVSPEFLALLGTRFSVARTFAPLQEATKEGQISSQNAEAKSALSVNQRSEQSLMMDPNDELAESVSSKRLQQLKSRLE